MNKIPLDKTTLSTVRKSVKNDGACQVEFKGHDRGVEVLGLLINVTGKTPEAIERIAAGSLELVKGES